MNIKKLEEHKTLLLLCDSKAMQGI